MKITAIRSDGVYSKIMGAPQEKKNDIYRYELMMSFQKKWDCYGIPMKAHTGHRTEEPKHRRTAGDGSHNRHAFLQLGNLKVADILDGSLHIVHRTSQTADAFFNHTDCCYLVCP